MTPANSSQSLTLDAEALYVALRDGVRRLLAERPDAVLIGIWSGGAWLAARLQADLERPGEAGVITSTLHRDDFGERGLAAGAGATKLPFSIDGRHVVLVDDVLYTGRTIRAVINELFDFGRPASVALAVLVDRGGRELPIQPSFAAARVTLSPQQRLSLARGEGGRFAFAVKQA
jgi:pyrimidine operon attenuation protein/uracil phosphoribosyltransferase